MSTPDAHELAITLYEERLKNDAWALRELMHREAVWELVGAMEDGSPVTGGGSPREMAEFIERVLEIWKWITFDLDQVISDGNRIACHYRVTVEHIPSGKRIRTQGAEFFTMESGFIKKVVSFTDPALARLNAG